MLAGVASGVVISLTALTAGVAPAVAEPGAVETTTVQAPPRGAAYTEFASRRRSAPPLPRPS